MKAWILALLCATSFAYAAPYETSPDMPPTAQAALAQYQHNYVDESPKLVQRVDKIVAYFDKDGKRVEQPEKRGYYRVHVGTLADGNVLVQDFYSDTQTKQTDKFVLQAKDLLDFGKHPLNPFHVTYQPNGEVFIFSHRNHQRAVASVYDNGQMVMTAIWQLNDNDDAIGAKFYRPNGRLLSHAKGNVRVMGQAVGEFFDSQERKIGQYTAYVGDGSRFEVIVYHNNGKILSKYNEKGIQIIDDKQQIWTPTGTLVQDLPEDIQKMWYEKSARRLIQIGALMKQIDVSRLIKYPTQN